MARPLRIEFEGATYHVMSRGNNGGDIFFSDEGRELFIDTLDEACTRAGWIIHAYVLMGNHYHLLLETPQANLVAGIKGVGSLIFDSPSLIQSVAHPSGKIINDFLLSATLVAS